MSLPLALERGACALCSTPSAVVWHDDPDRCPNTQPRERRVLCRDCGTYRTLNVSARCERCKSKFAAACHPHASSAELVSAASSSAGGVPSTSPAKSSAGARQPLGVFATSAGAANNRRVPAVQPD